MSNEELKLELDSFIKSGKAAVEISNTGFTTTHIEPLKIAQHFADWGYAQAVKEISPLNIKATIEKSKDGLFCIRSDFKVGDSYVGGFGLTEYDAKKDFEKSVIEAVKENITINFE